MNSFYIGHLHQRYDLQKIYPSAPLWTTCLRTIIFFDESQLRDIIDQAEAAKMPLCNLKDAQAYQYLLEVICGLKSKIVGETQVLGQFKIFLAALEKNHQNFYLNHRALFQSLLEDCKDLRQQHINNWGGRSYGSLTRKMVEHTPHVSMLGNGQLAQSLIPWLKEKTLVVYVRSPQQPQEQLLNCSTISNYSQPSALRSLVVAAPVDNSFLKELIEQVAFHQVIDWRAEISLDAQQLPAAVNYHSYNDLVSSIENEKVKIQQQVDLLAIVIQQKIDRWIKRKQVHPTPIKK